MIHNQRLFMLKLDILVLPVHPDDAELGCAGVDLKHIALGHKVGIIDTLPAAN
jgi:LmbE family N-acetylglucosaminyl deacetylase